ncbi:hypothetical protein ACHAXT_005446 [Thalassiosira profunda]
MFSADDLRYATETVDRIEKVTDSLCGEIERLFLHRVNPYTRCDPNTGAKERLMVGARRWVDQIAKLGAQETTSNQTRAAADALAQILRTLDDVDLENLQHLSVRDGTKGGKRKADTSTLSPSISYSNQRRRRWLPSNLHQRDVISGMHEAEALNSDEEDDSPGGLFLSNPARSYRAKHSDVRPKVSVRDVLNNLPERRSDDPEIRAVSTLTLDAAILRRDVYKFLAELDSVEIKAAVEQEECTTGKIKELASTLLERISCHLESPSMRLAAIITLDSLRELELNAMGYQSILDELLKMATPWSIKLYVEVISECDAYDSPVLYVRALSDLMQRALKMQSDDDQLQPTMLHLLRAIRHTIARRHRLLSSLSDANKCNSTLRRDIDAYRVLCDRMSARFDLVSDWIHPELSRREREQAISVLQGEGILSMFCKEGDDDHDKLALLQEPLQTEGGYPFAKGSSLRASHARMGPCDGVNRLLSSASAYEPRAVPLDATTSTSASLPSNLLQLSEGASFLLTHAGDDVLRTILSFLGHRSLARASQCCKSWQGACNATSLWAALYFGTWKKACFEEEMAAQVDDAKGDVCFERFLSIRNRAQREQLAAHEKGYDWRHLFMNKHLTEKVYKLKSCNVVGCLHVVRRGDQKKAHMKRHRSNLVAQSKKRHACNLLQTKVAHMRGEMACLENDVEIRNTTNAQSEADIDGPEAILKHLVFPYLEVRDIVKPVCKLWTGIARSDQLWEGLYKRRFCAPAFVLESQTTTARDWKQLFQEAFAAHRNIRGHVNDLGWRVCICPTIGCNKELRSSFEFDRHVLKHEEKYCLDRIKLLKKLQREQRRHERAIKARKSEGYTGALVY